MHVVCNNPVLYVVEYPALRAVEVIDKRSGKGTLIRDEAARRFCVELESLPATAGEDDFGGLMEHYLALFNQPAVYH